MPTLVDIVCCYCGQIRQVPSYYANRYTTCGSEACAVKRVAARAAAVKAANTGRIHSPEVNMSKGRPGRQQSLEHVENRNASRLATGWFKDPEAVGQKIGAAHRGQKRPKIVGSGNPMWRGGVSLTPDGSRATDEYAEWRKTVLGRTNGTCTQCGSTKHVIAHHLKDWHTHPHLRVDPENGIALCRKCHAVEHGLAQHFKQS